MKKEKYFRDELQRMFLVYAIVPAVIFTLVCGLFFMVVLLHGRRSRNREHNQYVSGELERMLQTYEEGLARLAGGGQIFKAPLKTEDRAGVFEEFYRISNELGYAGDLYVMDGNRRPFLSNREELPDYLNVEEGISWGIYRHMDSWPGETVVRLVDGWRDGDSAIAMGHSVVEEGKTLGYIVCALPGSRFKNVLDKLDTQIIITDRFGWSYVSNNNQFLDGSNQVLKVLEGTEKYLSYEKQMYLVSRQEVYHRMFRVYSVSDIQNIVFSLFLSSAMVITALAVMTGWVLISSRKATERKTEDFYRILDVMEGAREGNLEGVIHIDSDNEFKIIADAYNETMAGLTMQMENNKKMAQLVAAAQNKQLLSQFNPHFLYNTLENIRYMCKLEPATAERMVYSLSSLLRYSLDGSQAKVTLKEDLEHLKNYLTILERRFGSRFSYEIEVREDAMECRIPKLVLQPMIENAVKYGFGNQLNLKVELKAYIHEGRLMMICRDDGVGMSQGTLSELTALLEEKENVSRHSGLYNIHRRIGILYGRPYGVEIRSTEGHGTMLVVTLPADRGEETGC